MAKRKTKKTTSRRRRSISGVGGGNVTQLLSMVAGAVAGRIVAKQLEGKAKPAIVNGGIAAAGYFGSGMVKNPMFKGLLTGMAIIGAVGALQSTGVISAISGVDDNLQLEYMSGTDNLDVLAGDDEDQFANMNGLNDAGTYSGTDELSILAGDEDYFNV